MKIDEKEINFIILSPEPNIGRLKGTVRSIKNNYKQDAKIICSVVKTIKKPQIEEMNEVCPTYKAGNTVTSILNSGIKNANDGWNMLIMEGSWLPRNIKVRYFRWLNSDSDILFPIVVNYNKEGKPIRIFSNFSDCTLNGVLFNKEFALKVGKFSENPLEVSRYFWSMEAKEKGANFKAILGIKIC